MSERQPDVRRMRGQGATPHVCAYCHTPLETGDGSGRQWRCTACGTRLHADCRAEAQYCVTPGCRYSEWAAVHRRAHDASSRADA